MHVALLHQSSSLLYEVAPVLLKLLYTLLFSLMTFLTLALMNSVGRCNPQVYVMLMSIRHLKSFTSPKPSQHFTARPQQRPFSLNWEFLEFTLCTSPIANKTTFVSRHQTGSCSRLDSALSNKQQTCMFYDSWPEDLYMSVRSHSHHSSQL